MKKLSSILVLLVCLAVSAFADNGAALFILQENNLTWPLSTNNSVGLCPAGPQFAPALLSPSLQQTCSQDTAFGWGPLRSITVGGQDTAIGDAALQLITIQNENTAVGALSQYSNDDGTNDSFGFESLFSDTSGTYNVAMGRKSGYQVSSGSENIIIGDASMFDLKTGSYNIAIGNTAGFNIGAAGNNNIYIGSSPSGTGSSSDNGVIYFGIVGAQSNAFTAGQWFFPSNLNAYAMDVTNKLTNGQLSASSVVVSDANKALASIGNGAGALSNNGSGVFSWVPIPQGGGGGSGTVTSVAVAADAAGVVSWSGSPVTSAGTFTPTFAKSTAAQFGVSEPDGTTITASGGVYSVAAVPIGDLPVALANTVIGNPTGAAAVNVSTASPHMGGDVEVNTLIVTNKLTNAFLSASEPVITDVNSALSSVTYSTFLTSLQAPGLALNNTFTGNNTFNGTVTVSNNLVVGGAVTANNFFAPYGNSGLGFNMNYAVGTNYIAGTVSLTAPINLMPGIPNFGILLIVNTTGSGVQVNPAAGWKTNFVVAGGWSVTNAAEFVFHVYPGIATNVTYVPIW